MSRGGELIDWSVEEEEIQDRSELHRQPSLSWVKVASVPFQRSYSIYVLIPTQILYIGTPFSECDS